MTYEEFAAGTEVLTLGGRHVAAIYLALSADEESLDANQSEALEAIRALLYERLTIEQLESLGASYGSARPGTRDRMPQAGRRPYREMQ